MAAEWNEDRTVPGEPYIPRQGHGPGRPRGWGLEFRDCGAISGRGLLLAAERRCRGGEIAVGRGGGRKPGTAEARRSCCVPPADGAIPIASPPARQHRQLNSREAGRQTPEHLIYRAGPQPGAPPCARRAEQQRRISCRGALQVPERAEL